MKAVRNIVIACDGSLHAGQAAALAATLATALSARLHLVHVFPGSVGELFGMPGASAQLVGMTRFDQDALERLAEESATEAFDSADRMLGEPGVEIVRTRLSGDPAIELVRHAHGLDAPMIVVGPRGRAVSARCCSAACRRRYCTRRAVRCWLPTRAGRAADR